MSNLVYRFDGPVREALINHFGLDKVRQIEAAYPGNKEKILKMVQPVIEKYDRSGWAKDVFRPIS